MIPFVPFVEKGHSSAWNSRIDRLAHWNAATKTNWHPELIDLLDGFGLEKVNGVCLRVNGFPAVMVTNLHEVAAIRAALEQGEASHG